MPASSDRGVPALQARDISCERGGKPLFRGIAISVEAGHALFLVGPNGSGKTTLLRALAGLIDPVAGEVLWQGRRSALKSAEWRMQVAYAGHKSGLKDDLSVAENFELACALDGRGANVETRSRALDRVGLARRRTLPVKRLSQGQKQRLTLARLSVSRRPLWLLDEPTAALDAEGRELLGEIVSEHLDRGGLALVATHDRIALRGRHTAELRLG